MVSLKWGDILSTLLPGALALFAIAPWFPLLDSYMKNLEKVTVPSGIALLIAAALAGGVLEAFTRIGWERFFLNTFRPSPNVLSKLNQKNLDLYERGVQNSYKYVTFYSNFAWAIALIFVSRLATSAVTVCSISNLILGVTFILLLVTSYVQWTYFVNYLEQVFDREDF